MPLRDHFRPPVDDQHSWEELHGQWPAVIVHHLRKELPPGFIAGPRTHSGSPIEVDVATFEKDGAPPFSAAPDEGGGVATAVWAEPTVEVEAVFDFDEYEVRVYDAQRGRRLVAAVEIVSPANKDRPESRRAFVAKCSALIQQGVAVSIVDLVTTKRFNLYLDLLETIGHADPTLGDPPPTYAASCRTVKRGTKTLFQARSHRLEVGQQLPTLPLWLDADRVVPLNLEQSYEQACHDLWIT